MIDMLRDVLIIFRIEITAAKPRAARFPDPKPVAILPCR
jgi:hypothetical protein